MDLKLPLPGKTLPDRENRTPPDAEASALGLDIELGELMDSRTRGGRVPNKGKSDGAATALDDECVATRLGPVGVEVRVAGRVGRTDGEVAVAAQFTEVVVKERFDQASICTAGCSEFNRHIGVVGHAA